MHFSGSDRILLVDTGTAAVQVLRCRATAASTGEADAFGIRSWGTGFEATPPQPHDKLMADSEFKFC